MLSLQADGLHPQHIGPGAAALNCDESLIFFAEGGNSTGAAEGYHKRSVQLYSHSGGFRRWSAALKPGCGLGAGYEILSGRGSWTGGTRKGASTFIGWRPLQRARPRFRATGITTYLQNGGKVEVAQQIAGHESARTTGLYDRRDDEISLDEVERIVI